MCVAAELALGAEGSTKQAQLQQQKVKPAECSSSPPPKPSNPPMTSRTPAAATAEAATTMRFYIGGAGGEATWVCDPDMATYLSKSTSPVKQVVFGRTESGRDESWFVLGERGGYSCSLTAQYSDLTAELKSRKEHGWTPKSVALGPAGRYWAQFTKEGSGSSEHWQCASMSAAIQAGRAVKQVAFGQKDTWVVVYDDGGYSFTMHDGCLSKHIMATAGSMTSVAIGETNDVFFVETDANFYYSGHDAFMEACRAYTNTGGRVVGL